MNGFGPPAAVIDIAARVTQLSAEPMGANRLRDRFSAMFAERGTEPSATAGTTTTTTPPAFTPPVAPTQIAVGGMEAPRITRLGDLPRLESAPMPVGTWVDRIPNARGKALAPAIAAAADRYGLDPAFLAAVYWTESSYTPDAVSRTGAIGLGQLMPETAQWLGVDPWDPVQNIDGSARLYKYFLDRNNGDITLAIASYAAGPNAVKHAGGIPDQFTANYVTKLLARTDYLGGRRSTPP